MTKADLSMCIIVRGDPLLEQAVASVRPYVREICVASTSPDPLEQKRAEALADRFCVARHANQRDGHIADFSIARTASFALATRPWVTWMDSDDILVGGERLRDVIESRRGNPGRVLCPYEYEHDKDTGEPTVLQWRERIVPNDWRYHWERPVHETLVAKDGNNADGMDERVTWKHMRTERLDVSRNLRILREYAKTNGGDPWTMFNLGKDLAFAGEHREASHWLRKFVEATGDDEQRVAAMLRLAECEIAIDPKVLDGASRWASRARSLRPSYFGPRFASIKINMLRGIMGGDEDALHDVLNEGTFLIQMPPTTSLVIPSSPVERNFHVHDMMRQAAEILGEWNEALAATERALLARPKDPGLLLARKRYAQAKKLADLVPAYKHDTDRAPPPVADSQWEVGGFTYDAKGHKWDIEPIAGLAQAESEVDGLYDSAPPPSSLPSVTTTGVECRALDVVIVCGPTLRPFNPEIFQTEGVGGSETAVIEMAKRLAARGCTVRVYCDCGREGTWDGVDYLDVRSSKPEGACDVLISWRSADYLKWMDAKVRLVWAHDTIVQGMNWPKALRADRIIALSQWHKDTLVKAHGLHPSHVWVSRNGIDPKRFEQNVSRDPRKIIYSSSPDRGLSLMLDMWPAILAEVPGASLHVFYGFDGWARSAEARGAQHERYLAARMHAHVQRTHGVHFHGNVDQATLARELLSAGVWVLPGWFDETSCIGAMEARAAGCHIVASKRAALPETVGQWGNLIKGDWLSDEYRSEFVRAVSGCARVSENDRRSIGEVAHRELSWDGVADEWRDMFDKLLTEAQDATMPEYQAVGT